MLLRNVSVTLRLVVINVAILVAVTIVSFVSGLFGARFNMATAVLDLPAGVGILYRPWSIVTYMFTHTDVLHCLFNMLWLYWFGRLFEQIGSERRLALLYLAGGAGGGVLYVLCGLLWPAVTGTYLEGASAAVMAIVAAVACLAPNLRLNLLLLGAIRVKWIALATLIIFALGLTGSNAGAHIAHIGGLIVGAVWALAVRLHRPRYDCMSPGKLGEADARAELDILLDKVRRSGYNSLTANERRRLVELSHKV